MQSRDDLKIASLSASIFFRPFDLCSFAEIWELIFGLWCFEKLKKDAAFAPRLRPSSWRVSSYIKVARDLKIFLASSWRVVLHLDRYGQFLVSIISSHDLPPQIVKNFARPPISCFARSSQEGRPRVMIVPKPLLVRMVGTKTPPSPPERRLLHTRAPSFCQESTRSLQNCSFIGRFSLANSSGRTGLANASSHQV